MLSMHVLALAFALNTGNICTSQACVVYAQTGTDLYTIDPVSLTQSHVCTFSGTDSDVFDIAVDDSGQLYALTASNLYLVDHTNCQATLLTSVSNLGATFNGLTFLLDGRLIAVNESGVVAQIDPSSGAVTQLGSYGGNLGSSGDVVAVANGQIYATALDTSGQLTDDILVTLDPNNGFAATPVGTIQGYSQIYGLGYWAGVLYGFDAAGDVLKIDPSNGSATVAINNSFQWFGAGTTPQAPTTCTSTCTSGSTSCSNSGALLSCSLQSNGCYDWVPSSCPSGQACVSGACQDTCSSTCVPFSSQCADGTHVQSCDYQSNGCFDWDASACPAGQVCSGGSCEPSCTSTCNAGQSQCSGNDVQTCTLQSNGCFAWSTTTTCGSGELCSGGQCAASCSDACTAGATQCAGSFAQTCAVNSAGCTEWQNASDCGTAGCSSGACCGCTPGETVCDPNGNVEVCTASAASGQCPSWVAQPCASGACMNGTCLVACTPSSEVNGCPNGSQCLDDGSGTYCGYGADGGFVPAGSGSATGGSGGTSSSGGTTSGPTSSGGTTSGSGAATGSSTGLNLGTTGTTTGGGTTGSSAGAKAGNSVTTTGCGCGSTSPASGLALLFGLAALLGRRRRPPLDAGRAR